MIAQRRLPALVVVMIANGGGDAQGCERGLEYDTMSGKFAEFIQTEVLPLVESNCGVKLSRDPEARAHHGKQLGRFRGVGDGVVSPGMVSPRRGRTPALTSTSNGPSIPKLPAAPGISTKSSSRRANQNRSASGWKWATAICSIPTSLRDNMHDWVEANNRMAAALRAKGYHYQYVYALNAAHVAGPVRSQTLPEALEWVWEGYPIAPEAAK